MKCKARTNRGNTVGKRTEYVTKRMLVRAAGPAVRLASQKAMEVAGYVVKAENGWIAREYQDGSKSRISQIGSHLSRIPLVLD